MREKRLPAEMLRRPFRVGEAAAFGLDHEALQGPAWRKVRTGTYVWAALEDEPLVHLRAARLVLPPEAVFSGMAAAWLLGVPVPSILPVEVTVPPEVPVRAFSGMTVHRALLDERDLTAGAGLRCTALPRTLLDLARQRSVLDSLIVADQALHLRLGTQAQLDSYLLARSGRHGAKSFRRVVELADGRSESPMETELRLLLASARLPRPELQRELTDAGGARLGRVDLYYEDAALAVEYDGSYHRDTLPADLRRQNRILAAGYRLLRFTFADVRGNPANVVDQVRAGIRAAAPRNSRKRIQIPA